MLEDPWFDASADVEQRHVRAERSAGRCAGSSRNTSSLSLSRATASRSTASGCRRLQVMEKLNELGGKHGIGRVDMVENRFVGMKSRGVYETPGGTILFTAHRKMESLTMDREVMHLRDSLISKYATLVYNGFWFAPERLAIQALVTESQKNVTGTVRLKLYKGNVIGAGVKSPVSLVQSGYRHDGSRSDASLRPRRCNRLHPLECAAAESSFRRGTKREEVII